MNAVASTGNPTTPFKKAGRRETTVLPAVAWLVPLAMHLVPWAGERPPGAFLPPMFWATFGAGYLSGARAGLIVGLFALAINLAVTGLPAARSPGLTGFELTVFVGVAAHRSVCAAGLRGGEDRCGGSAAGEGRPAGVSGNSRLHSLARAGAGWIVLAAISAALVWFYPKHAGDEA